MRLSHAIITWLIPSCADVRDVRARAAVGLVAGWTSVGLNCALFALKVILATLTGSVSLVADAAHTLSDSLTSLVVIFGFSFARKPPDEKHPFGHGRMEFVVALVIGVLLAVTSVEMITFSIGRIVRPQLVVVEPWVLGVLILTMILKEMLARFSLSLGKLIDSEALRADGLHHRSDVLTTLLVIVAFAGMYWGQTWLDGAMGIGVAALIGWAAANTMIRSVSPLLGETAPESVYRDIEKTAHTFSEVQGVHEIMIHRYGQNYVVSLHIEVPDSADPLRLHEMSEAIEEQISRRFPGHTIVHVDPISRKHEHYDEVRRMVADAIAKEEFVTSFHDLRLIGGNERFKVVFDITTDLKAKRLGLQGISERIRRRLQERFPRARVVIKVEPFYLGGTHNGPESHSP